MCKVNQCVHMGQQAFGARLQKQTVKSLFPPAKAFIICLFLSN